VIILEGVSKSFAGKPALMPTSLTFSPRRTHALIGPSGCGKSTLLRLIVGLIPPDSGSVSIDSAKMTRSSARELRRKIGYVIQDGGLFPHLTAAKNITIMAEHLGWDREAINERLVVLSELTDFPGDLLANYPSQLSGGQRQRVGLMRGLMLDPEFLLLDEPLGALDPIIRSRLQADLREIFRRLRKTVLLVTHDMGEAAYLGDEIVLMSEGSVVQRGSLEDLLERPESPFVDEFIRAQRPLWSAGEENPR
jgi:osmoprotectant transport system ATP-binding protein